jgi:hypothetical protein
MKIARIWEPGRQHLDRRLHDRRPLLADQPRDAAEHHVRVRPIREEGVAGKVGVAKDADLSRFIL